VRKYSQVIQRYYVQYLSGYDAIALDQAIQVPTGEQGRQGILKGEVSLYH